VAARSIDADVAAHRRDLGRLTDLAERDLSLLWRRLDHSDPVAVREALRASLPRLVRLYGTAAATLAADWYDDLRESSGTLARRRFRARPAELPDEGRTDALARWGVGPLFTPTPDPVAALTLIQGGLQRTVADASRNTITSSAVADPAAGGWQRVGAGKCGFCSMLIGRGAIYSEATVHFASHDHCKCSAAPAFNGVELRPVNESFTPSSRRISDADRARTREYIRRNAL
jgi:hypothetical protein